MHVPSNPCILELQSVEKSFGRHKVVSNLTLSIRRGEFISLLGPSGCGKTTLLRLIGGFEQADSGHILLEQQRINTWAPQKIPVNTVFQNYALFPHLSVFENLAFGLKTEKISRAALNQRVLAMLKTVQMENFSEHRPHELSGGQQQRVALARALVKQPKLLLLDEPLNALDASLRKQMQRELKHLQRTTGITFIFVTHDREEALSLSDRVVVMRAGELMQVGSPQEVYEQPNCEFVAQFVGEINWIHADPDASGNIKIGTYVCKRKKPLAPNNQGKIRIGIRPEHLRILSALDCSDGIDARVLSNQYKGMFAETLVELCSGEVVCAARFNEGACDFAAYSVGAAVKIHWVPETELIYTNENTSAA